jgi:hypothetical protein
MMTAFKAVEVVTRVGYATISRIKTKTLLGKDERISSKILIILKKTADFARLFDEFAETVRVKREAIFAKKNEKKPEPAAEQKPAIKPEEVGSVDATTSDKSQSTPEKADPPKEEEKAIENSSKWWLSGVN